MKIQNLKTITKIPSRLIIKLKSRTHRHQTQRTPQSLREQAYHQDRYPDQDHPQEVRQQAAQTAVTINIPKRKECRESFPNLSQL